MKFRTRDEKTENRSNPFFSATLGKLGSRDDGNKLLLIAVGPAKGQPSGGGCFG